MVLLAVDTSAKSASVAVIRDDVVVADFWLNAGLTHSETLFSLIQGALNTAGLTHGDITHCAVSKGPGSFTGIRIGVCAVKGIALPQNLPCVGVSTLEAMAYNAIDHDGIVCCCMDARRNQVYNALFSVDHTVIKRLTPDRAISLEELKAELETYESPIFLVGDGAILCYNTVGSVPGVRLLSDPCRLQRALGVAKAAKISISAGQTCSAAELLPSYLRLSQAERERAEKLNNPKSSE